MNLISIEEHLFFTAGKTGKEKYFDLLQEVREMRKSLLKGIVGEGYEGEVWCISKHLLAASMRLIEVGTKELNKGNKSEAKNLFDKSYKLWSLFWGINLKLIDFDNLNKMDLEDCDCETEGKKEKVSLLGKLSKIIQKAVNCCKE